MKLNKLLAVGVFLLSYTAQAQLTLDGEFRPRTEYRNGYGNPISPNQKNALFTDQRTRLNFGYTNQDVKTYLSIQDIRVWGNTSQLNRSDGNLSVHQAWAQIPLDSFISLKAGRQEIIYDDHRIFGSVGWATQARSHDAALLKYHKKSLKVDLGLAYNQTAGGRFENLYTTPKNYKSMQYLYLNKELKGLTVSVLALNTGNQAVDTTGDYKTNYMQTVGGRLAKKTDKFSVSLNAFAQLGEDASFNPNKVSAYLVGLDFVLPVKDKSKVTLGYEIISGTSQVDTVNTEMNSFSPLFGTNHKFNGFMDYYYVGNHAKSVGLQDAYVKFNTKIKKFQTGVDVHMFMSAADVLDKAKGIAMDPYMGTEIDVYATRKISKVATLKCGYSHYLTSETLHAVKEGGDIDEVNNWAWVMLIVKPKFN